MGYREPEARNMGKEARDKIQASHSYRRRTSLPRSLKVSRAVSLLLMLLYSGYFIWIILVLFDVEHYWEAMVGIFIYFGITKQIEEKIQEQA